MDQQRTQPLLIVRLTRWLGRKIGSRLIASVLPLFFPAVVSGLVLEEAFQSPVFTRGIVFLLAWAAIAPWLITDASRLVRDFLERYERTAPDAELWRLFCEREFARLNSGKYLLFGLPWAGLLAALVVMTLYREAALPTQIWAGAVVFLTFLVSAMGFQGVIALVHMIRRFFRLDPVFEPFHPDRFGGMADMGRFAVRGALYFSTGALAFPLLLEVLEAAQLFVVTTRFLGVSVAAVFTATLFSAFFLPVIEIKKFTDSSKERVLLEARSKMNDLMKSFEEKEDFDPKCALNLGLFFHLDYTEMLKIKDYPYDVRTFFELGVSVGVPLLVAALEIRLAAGG